MPAALVAMAVIAVKQVLVVVFVVPIDCHSNQADDGGAASGRKGKAHQQNQPANLHPYLRCPQGDVIRRA